MSANADSPVLVVAVDGPSGSGKSSVSKAVASQLGYRYLDTGAMYRAIAWAVLNAGVDPTDTQRVIEVAQQATISSGTDPDAPTIAVDGVDVAEPIRAAEVTGAVSSISAVPEVRELLLQRQRAEVQAAKAAGVGIVVEGRDIGTTVLPDADVKVFLTADAAVRAARRHKEDTGAGRQQAQEEVAQSLAARDAADSSRAASPLTQAEDAHVVDATTLGFDEVVASVMSLMTAKTGD